jgi:hypothetical protein
MRKATASAAAILAILSWFDIPNIFWLAKLFWHSSLWLSLFALISTAPNRMLEKFLEWKDESSEVSENFSDEQMLKVLLRRQRSKKAPASLVPDEKIIWALQSPTMLTSYAWLCLLLGYGLYLLTPLLERGEWSAEKTVCPPYSLPILV